ncbi:hypothetical protein PR202_gb04771 [Eleusine coracana subsp. coracana]|uniref:Homeobox domain-containing protein n=1 Tax=Eleusine coracana subsp. coracana TaxID=191504 RepID=A0AAV5E5J1_ELECO|nr:hypothetical protein PR202_gb04771 [Eleusine coracana subsp. coracana]
MGRKGSEVSPSKRYPLRSTQSGGRILRSGSKDYNTACNEPLNDSPAAQPAARKRKSSSSPGSPNNSVRALRSALPLNDSPAAQPAARKRKSSSSPGSPNNSVRVLRSASKNKVDACNESLTESIASEPDANTRKYVRPSKAASPVNSVRMLRSASKNKNDACSDPLNNSTADEQAANKRKCVTPSKVGRPNNSVRVLRSASKNKNEAYGEPLNDNTVAQPSAKKRKCGSPLKVESPASSARVLRSNSKMTNETFNELLNDCTAAQPGSRKRKSDTPPKGGSPKLGVRVLRSASKKKDACVEPLNIFCAICGSKDVTLQNDIILCDGACDRGFHQYCLNPPLLTEDKDCIYSLQNVFPEAASFATGSKQLNASDLPLGDSEKNDYNPALVERHIVNEGERTVDDLGLPSEDSEDDDFDPAGSDSSEDQENKSHTEESDFTSDSDYFCAEIAKSCHQSEVSASPLSNVNEENWNRAFAETELDQDAVLPVSSRRQIERLDYKKLYDEAYGEESSSSSDDEEWSGKEKLEDSDTDGSVHPAKQCSRRASAGHPISQQNPQSEQQTKVFSSNGSNSTARRFGPIVKQKLKDHFEKDPYPSRATKENLAQELGLTFIQVDKWFASTRHSSRVAAAKKEKYTGNHITANSDGTTVDSSQVRAHNDEVLADLTADRNNLVHEEVMVQNNLDGGNKEDISRSPEQRLRRASQKELEDIETDSLAAANRAKRLVRRAPVAVEMQNNEHTQSERLHDSVNEQQTEAPCSNGSSSKARKYHFDPIVTQVHFEKDPYPSRSTVQSLAQELGLTLIQVRRWFSSTRHYSSLSSAKKAKDPGKHTNKKNDSTTVDSIQEKESSNGVMENLNVDNVREKESSNGVMENLNKDRNDMVSRKLMLQINLNEGNNDDIMFSQHPSCEDTVVTTPTAISREVGSLGYRPEENQDNGAVWTTGFEQGLMTTLTTVSREVGPPGYGPGVDLGFCASWNTMSKQRIFMTPATTTMPISQEVGPPGYGPRENQGNIASWNTSSEQRVVMTPTTSSRETCLPGYGPEEGQFNGASWYTSSERRVEGCGRGGIGTPDTVVRSHMDLASSTISREVGPPGYGHRENQVSGASWNTSTEQSVLMTPSTDPIDVGPPGYWSGENKRNNASWNNSCKESVFMTPTTTLSEAGPPGYWPRENKDNAASTNVASPKGRSAEKPELDDEARKKAIARELRRMKKFR